MFKNSILKYIKFQMRNKDWTNLFLLLNISLCNFYFHFIFKILIICTIKKFLHSAVRLKNSVDTISWNKIYLVSICHPWYSRKIKIILFYTYFNEVK